MLVAINVKDLKAMYLAASLKKYKNNHLPFVFNALESEMKTVKDLITNSNKVFKNNSGLKELQFYSNENILFNLLAIHPEKGTQLSFNLEMWQELKSSVITALRNERKSFLNENKARVKVNFIESLNFEAQYSHSQLINLLQKAYSELNIDEIPDIETVNEFLTLSPVSRANG